MSPERKIRTIHPEARVLDSKTGLVEYVASDESVDSYREIILAKGWRFSRFSKNAPFVDSHDYSCIDKLLGKVVEFRVDGNKLINKVQWAIDVEHSPLAKLGFDLTEKGYLKAVSVGFIPLKMAWPGSTNWAEAVKEAGLTADNMGSVWGIYLEQEQIELSACIIGANPNALAKAWKEKAIGDEQLARIGFGGDEQMRFLLDAAEAYDAPGCTPVLRSMIQLNMRRCFDAAPKFAKGRTTPPDAPAREREDAAASELRAQRDADFLKQLKSLAPGGSKE